MHLAGVRVLLRWVTPHRLDINPFAPPPQLSAHQFKKILRVSRLRRGNRVSGVLATAKA
jgi:hypothetical protein